MYPETKKGMSGGWYNNKGENLEKTENDFSRKESFVEKSENDFSKKESFVESTSKLTGESESTIKDNIRIAKNIIPEVKEMIRNEPIADHKTELLKLAKQEPEQQKIIAEKIVNKEITKIEDLYKPKIIIKSDKDEILKVRIIKC